MIFDPARETDDLLAELGGNRNRAEALECVHQSVREAGEAVTVLDDAFAFDIVEHCANLLGCELVVVQEFDEAGDGTLEVDVVLPERVVGVDEERFGRKFLSHFAVSLSFCQVHSPLSQEWKPMKADIFTALLQ